MGRRKEENRTQINADDVDKHRLKSKIIKKFPLYSMLTRAKWNKDWFEKV